MRAVLKKDVLLILIYTAEMELGCGVLTAKQDILIAGSAFSHTAKELPCDSRFALANATRRVEDLSLLSSILTCWTDDAHLISP